MITSNMTLRKMIDFEPFDEDMAMLPLDVVVYIKTTVISMSRTDNYDFIRFFFTKDIQGDFKDLAKTVFYDFDGRETKQGKFVTIFELYSLRNYANISDFLKEIMEEYTHEADVLIDFFTHDSKKYRLSNLDGIVKLEEMETKH